MATATDNFNRTENPLTTPWTLCASTGVWLANGTQAAPANLGEDSIMVYNGGALAGVGADQYAQAVIGTMTGGTAAGLQGAGVGVRWATAALTGYWATVNAAATGQIGLVRFVGGAFTQLGTFTQAFATGDILRLEVAGSGTSTVLTVKKALAASPTSFAIVTTFPDSAGGAIDSGFPGLPYSSGMTAATLDNWEGGDLVSVTWEQEGYRWRNDDGSEVTATYIGAQDTPL